MRPTITRLTDRETHVVTYAIDYGQPFLFGPFFQTRADALVALAAVPDTSDVRHVEGCSCGGPDCPESNPF